MGKLDGRIALVTGASRGIGAEIARRFAAAGARVAVSARTTEPGQSRFAGTITETVGQIRKAGGEAVALAADLAVPDDRERLVAETEQVLGPIDVLVNNAAVTYFAPVGEFTFKRYALMFEVQVTAPFHLAKLVLPGMRERGRGWILNISSKAALHPVPGGPAFGGTVYGMCKAALERFTTGLAAETYADGVVVNALSPTDLVITPGTRFHRLDERIDQVEEPSVMAEAALMLCSGTETGRVTYSQELLSGPHTRKE